MNKYSIFLPVGSISGPDAALWESYLTAMVENDMDGGSEANGEDELDAKFQSSIIKLVATICLLSCALTVMWLILAL